MLSLIQELNEALDLWASLLPKTVQTPLIEPIVTEYEALVVPDSLPLLQNVKDFFQQTAWLGEQKKELENVHQDVHQEKNRPESSQVPVKSPIQSSVSVFFKNTNWGNQEELIQEPFIQEQTTEDPLILSSDSGIRLTVNGFFSQTAWNGKPLPTLPQNSENLIGPEDEANDVTHFFEDIRW